MSHTGTHYVYLANDARRERVYAAMFSLFLGTVFCVSIAMSLMSSGPIILGTERNANGMVEYMCLGNGCENLNDFHWSDK